MMNRNVDSRKRHGFSLSELVIVLVIIGVLGVMGSSLGGRQIANARLNTASNDLQIIATEIENAIMDMGFIEEVSEANKSMVADYLASWDVKYLTAPLNTADIKFEDDYDSTGYAGCMVNTENFPDPWGNEYRLYYLVADIGGVYNYRIVLASAGPNSTFASDAENAYTNKQYDDDVVMIMEPRN